MVVFLLLAKHSWTRRQWFVLTPSCPPLLELWSFPASLYTCRRKCKSLSSLRLKCPNIVWIFHSSNLNIGPTLISSILFTKDVNKIKFPDFFRIWDKVYNLHSHEFGMPDGLLWTRTHVILHLQGQVVFLKAYLICYCRFRWKIWIFKDVSWARGALLIFGFKFFLFFLISNENERFLFLPVFQFLSYFGHKLGSSFSWFHEKNGQNPKNKKCLLSSYNLSL